MSETQRDGGGVGHVFVVRGRLEDVVHDVAIVPTDDAFKVRDFWHPLVTSSVSRKRVGPDLDATRPSTWPDPRGFGPAPDEPTVWFVSVGSESRLSVEALLDRADGVVRAAAASVEAQQKNRSRPLVAMPVLGIAGGGHGAERGAVIRQLLARLTRTAAETGVDVAVVTPDPAVYAAAQHLRREVLGLDDTLRSEAGAVAERARRGELALFLGAGVSIPAGLPTWGSLLQQLAAEADLGGVDLSRLAALDQAELIEKRLPSYQERVSEIVRQHRRPALAHCLLAALGCREVVTTNYDRLYETAVGAGGEDAATVLPWQSAVGSDAWVLKMHGDVEHTDSIVLTRRHFVRFDATTRPAGSLLQSVLMTRHLLLVGASLNDDNVVRLVHEVQAYRKDHDLEGPFGTLFDVDHDEARESLWGDVIDWRRMDGGSVVERARSLEVFLDTVACLAATDAPWLLDERFADLLDEADRSIAEDARELHRRLSQARSPAFGRLRAQLREHGARDE